MIGLKDSQWLRDLPARTTLKLFNQRHVRSWLGHRYDATVLRHRAALPPLSLPDARIVEDLDTRGIHVTTLGALAIPGGEAVLSRAAALAENFADSARALSREGRSFIIVPPEKIVRSAMIFRWGLQDRLLDIAEAYLGLPAAYDGVAINYTVADGRAVSTRKWHRDWEDRRMLKVAVYLHAVDDAGGPFQQISRPDTLQDDLKGFTYALSDDRELEQRLGAGYEADVVSCEGPRGTVVFCDTARYFHRGKPAISRDRAALFYSYFADPPRHPFLCERTGLSRADIEWMVRRLPERQRRAALWRRRLPPLLKLIPPASL
ncbi:hypothetical protein [Novosphingobium sp.]|uniref:hypothetical protein n=1 Tax=Novosphingobium sp. TaxID=1874826 RepID=UPI003D6CD290